MSQQTKFQSKDQVRVIRIIDDHVCHQVGQVGIVRACLALGSVIKEPRYLVSFTNGVSHAFYESELTPYT